MIEIGTIRVCALTASEFSTTSSGFVKFERFVVNLLGGAALLLRYTPLVYLLAALSRSNTGVSATP